jgi:hypothetical protein
MSLRVSLVSTVLFALSALGMGGCAVDAESVGEAPPVETHSETQALDLVTPASSLHLLFAPECRATLLFTGPAAGAGPNQFGCSDADPYKGQLRVSGGPEGPVVIKDEAVPAAVTCTIPALKSTCTTKGRDRVIERLCTETRTYECPCGAVSTVVNGQTVGSCRAFPQ